MVCTLILMCVKCISTSILLHMYRCIARFWKTKGYHSACWVFVSWFNLLANNISVLHVWCGHASKECLLLRLHWTVYSLKQKVYVQGSWMYELYSQFTNSWVPLCRRLSKVIEAVPVKTSKVFQRHQRCIVYFRLDYPKQWGRLFNIA